jgi:hypothetical protein
MPGALGRNVPPDFDHVAKYPLTALPVEARPKHVPVAIGVNWYDSFDTPIQEADGTVRLPDVAKGEQLGNIRGGHCFCLEPAPDPALPNHELDIRAFYAFYDQGQEGACEGFGHARVLSLVYGRTFDAFWLYDDARRAEGSFPEGEGATNRGVLQALVKWGIHYQDGTHALRSAWQAKAPGRYPVVKAYRWATTAQDVLATLGVTNGDPDLLNSWGPGGYPERVKMPAATLDRLLQEEGEADVITER